LPYTEITIQNSGDNGLLKCHTGLSAKVNTQFLTITNTNG